MEICPRGSLSHSHFPAGTVHPIRSEIVPTYDQVLELVRSRRSKRAYKEKPVEQDAIGKVLEADSVGGTFAGTNANIAVHNAALAAEALGLGCYYAGFVVIVSERDDSIARLVGLPETHK